MKQTAFLLLIVCCAVYAQYPPISPLAGDYQYVTTTSADTTDYFGGRIWYDFTAGYVRVDAYNASDNNPGVNQVSVYDLRDSTPLITTVDANGVCYNQLTTVDMAPSTFDWTGYKFAGTNFVNKKLAEKWIDGTGNYAHFDLFNRALLAFGSDADSDGPGFLNTITGWSTVPPDGREFLVPNTLPCSWLNGTSFQLEAVERREVSSLKCTICKKAVSAIRCVGTQVGAGFCPGISAALCSIAARLICKAKLSNTKVCHAIPGHFC
jgi:hypothetical protein